MKSFIKISFRRIARERIYAIVNVLGLALGMASAMLIFLFLRYETTYDRWHPDYENTYRVGTSLQILDNKQDYAVSSAAIAPALVADYEEFVQYLRIFHVHYFLRDMVYQHEAVRLYEKDVFAVDSGFFDFFGAEFLEGTADNTLEAPFSMVVTESMAHDFFGNEPALGQRIWVPEAGFFTITAVVKDAPLNTHFRYRALLSLSTLHQLEDQFRYAFGPGVTWQMFEETFGSTILWSYVRTKPGFDAQEFLEMRWPDFHKKYISSLAQTHHMDMHPVFQRMDAIHMDKDLLYDRNTEKVQVQALNRQLVRVFFVIALFLLVVAAINYTNIAISNFNKRRMEMAVVKILGSISRQVFAGFFVEAMITAAMGLILGLVLLELIIPGVNTFLQVELSLNFSSDFMILIIVFFVLLFTSLLAGVFPAIYFARSSVVYLMTHRISAGHKSLWVKKMLVVLQFAISAFMISSSLLVYNQMHFMQNKDIGYSAESIAAIDLQGRHTRNNAHVLDSLLRQYDQIENIAPTSYVFTLAPIKHSALFYTPKGPTVRSFNNVQTTGAYLNLMGVNILDGDNVVDPHVLDQSGNVFINKALADSMGFDNPVGQVISTHFQFLEGRLRAERTIAGVLDNVHYALLNQPPEPLILLPMTFTPNYLAVRFSDNDRTKQEEAIKQAWQQYDPGSTCSFFFLEDTVQGFYDKQKKLSRFFGYFAWLCVIISFLGVFGITAYNLEQRTSEIAVRKVMGASWSDVFVAFFTDYIRLLIFACLVGIIASFLSLQQWLGEFAYSAGISPVPFLMAFFLVSLTVIVAVAIHTFRSQNISPAKALRSN